MNRLTDDQVAEGIKIIVDGLIEAGAEPAMSDRRYVRLAEYERTGLSPEQIKKLQQQAEDDRSRRISAEAELDRIIAAGRGD